MNDNKLLYGALIGRTTTNNFITMAGFYYMDSSIPLYYESRSAECIECRSIDSKDNSVLRVDLDIPTNDYEIKDTTNICMLLNDEKSTDNILEDDSTTDSHSINVDQSIDDIVMDGRPIGGRPLNGERSTDNILEDDSTTDSHSINVDQSIDDIVMDGRPIGGRPLNGERVPYDIPEGDEWRTKKIIPYKDMNDALKRNGYVVIGDLMEHLFNVLGELFRVRACYQRDNIKFIDDMLKINIRRVIKHIKTIIFMDMTASIEYHVRTNIWEDKTRDTLDEVMYTVLINWDKLGDIMVDDKIHWKSRMCIINNTFGINYIKKDTMMIINLGRANNTV